MEKAGVAGEDSTMRLEYSCFQRLVRHLHDLCENERLAMEHSAILMSRFSKDEVRSFREIFVSLDKGGHDCLSLDQVKEMLRRAVPMGDKFTNQLRSLWSGKASQGGDIGNIDFSELLHLMRRLLDADFGGIASTDVHRRSSYREPGRRYAICG